MNARIGILIFCGFFLLARPAAAQTEPATAPASAPATAPASQPSAAFNSPRATMFTFLGAMDDITRDAADKWDVVAQCFDLSQLPPGDRQQQVQQLAEELFGVLNRLGEVKSWELPSAELIANGHRRRYTYFPRYPDPRHYWVRKALGGKMPKGEVVLVRMPSGDWKFSAETLADMNDLYNAMKNLPIRYEGGAGQIMAVLGPTFENTPLWGWLVLLSAIFLGVMLGKTLQVSFRNLGHRLHQRGKHAHSTVFHNAASPLSLACVAGGLTVGLQFIHMEEDLGNFAQKILKLLYLLVIAWFLYNVVDLLDLALRRLTEKTENKLDDQVVPLVRKTLRIFLVVVFVLLIAQNVFGVDITAWLAGLGIAGLAISLAAQDSIKNLFGSITIFFDKPFAVGDHVLFDGTEGEVEEIGFRSSRIRTPQGHLVTVPNMKFIDNKVENISERPGIKRETTVAISRDTPPEKIEEAVRIIRDTLADPEIASAFDLQESPPQVAFSDFGPTSFNIQVVYWYMLGDKRDYGAYLEHAQRFNLKLFRALARAGVKLA